MSIVSQERLSESPLIASVTQGQAVQDGFSLRPALNDWHMVFVGHRGKVRALLVGPKTAAGIASWEEALETSAVTYTTSTMHRTPHSNRGKGTKKNFCGPNEPPVRLVRSDMQTSGPKAST